VPEAPLKVAFYRSAFAAAVLFLYFRPRRVPRSGPILVAIAAYAGCLTTFVVATKWTTAANAIFLQFTGVVWVLLAAPLLLGEPRRRGDTAAIIAAFAGMALCFGGRLEGRSRGRRRHGALVELPVRFPRDLTPPGARERSGGGRDFRQSLRRRAPPAVRRFESLRERAIARVARVSRNLPARVRLHPLRGRHPERPGGEGRFDRPARARRQPDLGLSRDRRETGPLAVAGGAIVLAAVAWRTLAAGPPATEAAPPD
jgi:hypothetical protein